MMLFFAEFGSSMMTKSSSRLLAPSFPTGCLLTTALRCASCDFDEEDFCPDFFREDENHPIENLSSETCFTQGNYSTNKI